jgi:hypothetical protein
MSWGEAASRSSESHSKAKIPDGVPTRNRRSPLIQLNAFWFFECYLALDDNRFGED